MQRMAQTRLASIYRRFVVQKAARQVHKNRKS